MLERKNKRKGIQIRGGRGKGVQKKKKMGKGVS